MDYEPVFTTYRKNRVQYISLLLGLFASLPLISSAGGLFFTELSETELSEIRGMYVSRSKIQYFGLSMTTQWGTPSRATHNAGMNIAMRVDGNTPQLQISRSGTLGEEVDSNSVKVAESNPALEQIGGVVQSIEVAGVDNSAHNKIALNIIDKDSTQEVSDQLILPAGRHTYTSESGATTDFSINDQKIGYTIATEKGVVSQALAYNAISNTNQLLQSAKIFGNGQSIVNSVRLDVAFDNTQQLRTDNANFGIRSLMGR